jgi:hypothetical protein
MTLREIFDHMLRRKAPPGSRNHVQAQFPDLYIELDLKDSCYSLRSFAFGGQPYFQIADTIDGSRKISILEDINSCKITEEVLGLFDGLDRSDISRIPCYINDRRKKRAVKFKCALVRPHDPENELAGIEPEFEQHTDHSGYVDSGVPLS